METPHYVKHLTTKVKQLEDKVANLTAEVDILQAAIQRVRELHSSEGRTWADFDTCADCHKAYPCPTTRALTEALGGER